MFIIISLFLAFFSFSKLDNTLVIANVKNLEEYLINNNLNFIFNHFLSVSLIITCSLTLIGLIFIPIYILYEIFSIFYAFYIFIIAFSFKGFIYAILFNIITKGLYLFFLFIIIRKIRNIVLLLFKNKENIDLKYSLSKNIKAIIISIILIIISDILIYFIGTKILLKLTFIL